MNIRYPIYEGVYRILTGNAVHACDDTVESRSVGTAGKNATGTGPGKV